MDNTGILSYGLVDVSNPDNSNFSFPDLLSVPDYCKELEKCKITCLSYKKNENKEQIRKTLQEEISRLGYVTISKDEFEKTRLESQREIEDLTAKNYFNPLGKNKTREERLKSLGLDVLYASPFIFGATSILIDSGMLLAVTTPSCVSLTFFAEGSRRSSLSKEKSKIKKLENRFNDPNNGFFCELKEVAPKLEADTVYVDEAHRFVENMRNFRFVSVDFKKEKRSLNVNYNAVNNELIKIYQSYAAQLKT